MVNDIMLDDKANKAFNKIDRNITGVDWKAKKKKELEAHMHT